MHPGALARSSSDFSDLNSLEDSLRLEEDSDSAPLQVNAEPEEKWPDHAVPVTVSAKAVLSDALLEAVRGLRVAEPDLGFKPLLAKLREQQPDLGAATKEVREALKVLKAESEAEKEAKSTAAPSKSSHPSVLDRGRGSSLSLLDTTGDGQPNLVGIDTTGDGFVDSLAVDTTGDGRVDHVCSAGSDPTSIHLVDTSVSLPE